MSTECTDDICLLRFEMICLPVEELKISHPFIIFENCCRYCIVYFLLLYCITIANMHARYAFLLRIVRTF